MGAVLFLIGFVLGMFGAYKIKHGMVFGGIKYLVICLVLCGIGASVGGDDSGKSSDKPATKVETQAQPTNSAKKWKTDLDSEEAVNKNFRLCIDEMNKMDIVDLARGQRVTPDDVFKNPGQYVGKVIEFPAVVAESEELPTNSPASKSMGGSSHVVIAQTEDGHLALVTRKGKIDMNSQVGEFTVVVGMLAGITDMDNNQKALVVVGSPK